MAKVTDPAEIMRVLTQAGILDPVADLVNVELHAGEMTQAEIDADRNLPEQRLAIVRVYRPNAKDPATTGVELEGLKGQPVYISTDSAKEGHFVKVVVRPAGHKYPAQNAPGYYFVAINPRVKPVGQGQDVDDVVRAATAPKRLQLSLEQADMDLELQSLKLAATKSKLTRLQTALAEGKIVDDTPMEILAAEFGFAVS